MIIHLDHKSGYAIGSGTGTSNRDDETTINDTRDFAIGRRIENFVSHPSSTVCASARDITH
jgi:hypothetical protein